MIETLEFRAMNTPLQLVADGREAVEGMYVTRHFIEDCEQRFSRFIKASELSELNRSAGNWVVVSDDLFEMIKLSLRYYAESNGVFDPSILPDLKLAGYDKSMDDIRLKGAGVKPTGSVPASRPALNEVELDEANKRIHLPQGLEIDLGGIAKGWIVDKAAKLLHLYADVCGVNAGGDMLLIGSPLDGKGWDVDIENPRDPTRNLTQLNIQHGAVATSSIMKRSWKQDGVFKHHIINPRTGQPAKGKYLSVTVICDDIIRADVFAKTILLVGPDHLVQHNFEFIAVEPNGRLAGSQNYKDLLNEPNPDPNAGVHAAG